MEEFAEEADDKSMIKLLKYYRKHHGMRMSRYIAVKLHQTKHVRFIELLTEKSQTRSRKLSKPEFEKKLMKDIRNLSVRQKSRQNYISRESNPKY